MPCSRTTPQEFTIDDLRRIRRLVATRIIDNGERLAIHEVCLNAVTHGGGTGWLAFCGRNQTCQVWDHGQGIRRNPAPQVESGRGLLIARSLATVVVASGPCGTLVTIAPG